jgi:hypothetical protein
MNYHRLTQIHAQFQEQEVDLCVLLPVDAIFPAFLFNYIYVIIQRDRRQHRKGHITSIEREENSYGEGGAIQVNVGEGYEIDGLSK